MTYHDAFNKFKKVISIIESLGFRDVRRWPESATTYSYPGWGWDGIGSCYITLTDDDHLADIEVRISDHPPAPGGGSHYSTEYDRWDSYGDSDISLHPGSKTTLRNLRKTILSVWDRKIRENRKDGFI